MHAKISALAIALLTTIGACDSSDAATPTEGSCQALVDEAIANDDEDTSCWIALGITDRASSEPDTSARCVASLFDLEQPPADLVDGLAYQVAYQALCDVHGDNMPQYCEISASIGCEG